MTEHQITFDMRPPTWLERAAYRATGRDVPTAAAAIEPVVCLAVLVPYRFRRFHEGFARGGGFFWLPCDLCDRPFGGHEAGGSIPDPIGGPYCGILICGPCTKARRRKGLPV